MYLRLFHTIIFLLLSSINGECKVIEVSNTKKNFRLEIDEGQNISIKGYLLDLNLKKTTCNESIIKNFIVELEMLLKSKPLKKNKENDNFKFSVDGAGYYEAFSSKLGVGLLSTPSEIQRMKIQDQILCGKKKY